MAFYRDHIYPHLLRVLGDPKPIQEVRQRVVPLAQGDVLEIGVGPGVNFVHYDVSRVKRIYALEPNASMIRLAEQQRRQTKLNVEYLDLPGERIPCRMPPSIQLSALSRYARFQEWWKPFAVLHAC